MKLLTLHILLNSINPKLQSDARPLPLFLSETAPTQISSFHHPDATLHTTAGWKKKNVHLYFISRATNRFSRRAKRQTERQVGGRQVEETVWKEGRGRGCTKHVWVYISLKRELLKFSFWRECGLSIGLSALRSLLSHVLPWGFSDPPDVWISWFKWQGRLRETPTGPALPGFQRPSDPVAVGCQGGDGNVWRRDNLYRTEPRVVRLFDRLINGKAQREKKKKKNLSAAGSGEKKPSLITRTPGIKAWPALIN